MEEKRQPGSIVLENREKLFLYGVSDSESFDENTAVLITGLGRLVIGGKNLHLAKLSLETGEAVVEGFVSSLCYAEKKSRKKENILIRIFK